MAEAMASPKTPEEHRQEPNTQKLQSQYTNLERDWYLFKHSNPPRTLTRRTGTCRSTAGTKNGAAAGIPNSFPRLLDPCSKNLTPTLLQETSSPESESESNLEPEISAGASTTWKVWNNELAFEDIHQQRRASIDAGRLKGRCLQEALEEAVVDRSTALDGVTDICSFINCSDGPAVDDSERDDGASDNNQSSSSRRCPGSCCSSAPPSDSKKNMRSKRREGSAIAAGQGRQHAKSNNVSCSGGRRRSWKFVLVMMTGIALTVLALLDPRRFLEGDEAVITVPT